MKIGYVGLGALGSELARRFLSTHTLTVWDLNPAAASVFTPTRASVATSAAQLARECDVVLLCLPRSSDVHQLMFGAGAMAEGLSAGKLVIDQTSGVPVETREISERLAQRGVAMLDAGVSASPHVVAQGAAVLMVGGPDDLYERALPVLHAITRTIYRCGTRVGDGQAMKMVNNAMNCACRLGTLEVAAMGRRMGLPLELIAETLNKGSARNQTTEKMLPALVQGKSSTNFALSLMLKDVNQAVSLGMDLGVPMPICNVVRGLLQIGLNSLGNDARLEDMVGVIASMAGTHLGPSSDAANAAGATRPDESILPLLDNAVASLCRLVTYECVAVGFKYGLTLDSMSAVINKSSGWSAQSREILPALRSTPTTSNVPLEPKVRDLRLAASLSMRCGAPMMISNVVRNLFEAGVGELEGSANVDAMRRLYESMAGIEFTAS